jgi:lipopolysaccharide transport protein LptA
MKTILLILGAAGLTWAIEAQTTATDPEPNAGSPPAAATPAAQTNSPTAAGLPTPARPATEIFADSGDFNLKTHLAVYTGHVRIEDPQMKLTCGVMIARVPQSGRIDSIVAEQNVVIDAIDNEGKPVHATGDKAVYTYRVVNTVTNETVELTGNPRVQKPGYEATADTITWDRINNTFRLDRPHIVIQPEIREHTNSPAAAEAGGKKK